MTADRFERALLISLSAHCVLAALLFLRAVFVPDESIAIRNAIRVDVVGLPQKIKDLEEPLPPAKEESAPAAPEKVEPAPKAKAEVKPEAPTIPNPNAKKADLAKSQKKALEELKRLSALERIKDQLAKGKSPEAGKQVAGNKLSQGNSLTGLDKLEYDRYFDEISQKMRANFSFPQWLADAGYKVQVQVLVDERGYIIRKFIVKSSGNDVFDAKAIEAVEASSPLPAPPQRLQGPLSTSGITLGFPQ